MKLNVRLNAREIEALLNENMYIIDREVNRAWGKMYQGQGVVDRQDLKSEALKAFTWVIDYFDDEKRPVKYFSAFLCTAVQHQLENTLWATHRKMNDLFDDPAWMDNIAEPLQALLPSKEDLEIIMPLSKDATMFIDAVFSPPESLKLAIHEKWFSGKPHSRNVLAIVLKFLGFSQDKYDAVVVELQVKCKYNFS